MNAQETLDKFGEFLMKKYRDKGIFTADGLLSNYWKAPALKEMQDALAELSEGQKQLVRKVVEEVLDSAMHDFLFAVTDLLRFTVVCRLSKQSIHRIPNV